jgi:hypothetical protein
VLEAHEVLPGRNYYILLTTSSGFYRYDIHDLVRCVGKEGTAPVLEFLNKGSRFSSITGEKISEIQVSLGVPRAFEECGLEMELFTLCPQWGDPPGYMLLTEENLDEAQRLRLARAVDHHLGQMNCEYGNRLETGRLRPLVVKVLPQGTWSAYRATRIGRMGGSLEQYKHPNLVSDLEFVDKLLAISRKSFATANY